MSSLAVGVPCLVYGQEEQGWYHGIISNVEEEFIEVRHVDADEIQVVKRPLDGRYFRYFDEEEEEALYEIGEDVVVYWDEEDEWYKGEIERVSNKKGVHVRYEDGSLEWISWAELREKGEELLRRVEDEVKERKGVKRKASDAFHECGILGCTYKAKQAGTLRQHQANIHK